jgi:CDP-L-myo-inositol myo-inositolphosphotransferase
VEDRTKCLIIAAGKGSRFESLTKDKPKPLLKLLGLSLIERVILTAKRAGISEFVIVIGYLGEKIKEKLGDGGRYGVKIDYIENREWDRENGVSVMMAKDVLKEDFILLMADHMFDAEILSELRGVKLDDKDCVLVIDTKPEQYIDIKEATKVKVEDGKIVNAGKDIEDYNGFDCGIFLLSPRVFDALQQCINAGDETLTGGIRNLARQKRAGFMDVKNRFWIDIDTLQDYRNAEKILLKKLTKLTDGPVSRFLNRPVSKTISRFLVKTNIKPNLISFFSFVLCLVSAILFALGSYIYVLIAGLIAQLSSIIDGCDGEVARLKFQESDYGAWFDTVLDRYADGLMLFGMMYGCWSLYGNIEIWVAGFVAIIGSFVNSYTAIRYDSILSRQKKRPLMRVGRDIRLFLIMIGAVVNQIFYTLIILGILTNVESIRRLYVLRK